jgi:hypothetical protein
MENQHRVIKGYELSAEEIALMNEVKEEGQRLADLLKKVEDHINKQYMDQYDILDGEVWDTTEELDRLNAAEPYRWLQHAVDEYKTATMKLVRAVAQPTTF